MDPAKIDDLEGEGPSNSSIGRERRPFQRAFQPVSRAPVAQRLLWPEGHIEGRSTKRLNLRARSTFREHRATARQGGRQASCRSARHFATGLSARRRREPAREGAGFVCRVKSKACGWSAVGSMFSAISHQCKPKSTEGPLRHGCARQPRLSSIAFLPNIVPGSAPGRNGCDGLARQHRRVG